MSSVGYLSPSMVAQNIANLPHYNTNVFKDLPADAAPEGVLANGDVYYNAYKMLTPSDTSLLKAVTGQSFDLATIAPELADGTFQGDPLAAAIGNDRADAPLGLGGITGDITANYLQSIEVVENDPNGDGTYEGLKISSSELSTAMKVLAENNSGAGETPKLSVSA